MCVVAPIGAKASFALWASCPSGGNRLRQPSSSISKANLSEANLCVVAPIGAKATQEENT